MDCVSSGGVREFPTAQAAVARCQAEPWFCCRLYWEVCCGQKSCAGCRVDRKQTVLVSYCVHSARLRDISQNSRSGTSLGSGWPRETFASLWKAQGPAASTPKASVGARRGSTRPVTDCWPPVSVRAGAGPTAPAGSLLSPGQVLQLCGTAHRRHRIRRE